MDPPFIDGRPFYVTFKGLHPGRNLVARLVCTRSFVEFRALRLVLLAKGEDLSLLLGDQLLECVKLRGRIC